jgi:hypothetical protein
VSLKKEGAFLTHSSLIEYGIPAYSLPLGREGMDAPGLDYIGKLKSIWKL